MRQILLVSLFFVAIIQITAQTAITQKTVKVIDFGQMYSTYNWETVGAELRANLGNTLANAVIANSIESAWPEGINSLSDRAENRTKMAEYTVNYLTTINNAVAVLVVPAIENKHMPANMQAAKDIYFVIGLSGVDLSGTPVPAPPAPTPTPVMESNFATQLNAITNDFGDGFVNLTGAQIDEDEEGLIIVYESRAALEGSNQLYFTEDLLSSSTSFHAAFPSSTIPVIALRSYQKLVRQVETLKLTCCNLQKQEETINGNIHTQLFTVRYPEGKTALSYETMVINVRIDQGETLDKNGQLVSEWIPVLSIYEQ